MKDRSLKVTVVISLVLLFGWFLLAWAAARWLIVERPLEKADAILMLSGSRVYAERARKTAEAYRQGVAPVIFLTDDGGYAGWSARRQDNPAFVELAKLQLVAEGVPESAIEILPDEVTGTEWEAKALARHIRREGLSSVVLVTSAYHTRRAHWIFEQVLAENGTAIRVGVIHAPPGEQTPSPLVWWLKPFGWQVVAGEYVKGAAYWIYY